MAEEHFSKDLRKSTEARILVLTAVLTMFPRYPEEYMQEDNTKPRKHCISNCDGYKGVDRVANAGRGPRGSPSEGSLPPNSEEV